MFCIWDFFLVLLEIFTTINIRFHPHHWTVSRYRKSFSWGLHLGFLFTKLRDILADPHVPAWLCLWAVCPMAGASILQRSPTDCLFCPPHLPPLKQESLVFKQCTAYQMEPCPSLTKPALFQRETEPRQGSRFPSTTWNLAPSLPTLLDLI